MQICRYRYRIYRYVDLYIRFQVSAAEGCSISEYEALRPRSSAQSSSCAKHFFAYSLENCFIYGDNCRLNFNALVDQLSPGVDIHPR